VIEILADKLGVESPGRVAIARLLFRDTTPPLPLRGPLYELALSLESLESSDLQVLDESLEMMCGAKSKTAMVDELHQRDRFNRRTQGVYYTPPGLARWLVDRALDGLDEVPKPLIGDPCCGCGAFLIASVDALVERGLSIDGICGTDLDDRAIEIARVHVHHRAEELGVAHDALAETLVRQIRVGDGLTDLVGLDVVVSNPPFGSAITQDTARTELDHARYRKLFADVARGAYDISFLFAVAAVQALEAGGRYGLVMPRSSLSLSSGAGMRAAMMRLAPPEIIWAPDTSKLFDGADVFVALIVGERGGDPGQLRVSDSVPDEGGGPADELRVVDRWPGDTWSAALLAEYPLAGAVRDKGIELARLDGVTTIFGGAATGAAYDLRPLVTEKGTGLKLVTTGLIDRYECLWGVSRCRYLKRDYSEPRWPALERTLPTSVRRASERQYAPKILVGGLSRVIEAVADPLGELGGVVSTWVVQPNEPGGNSLWLMEAFLNSPVLSLIYMTDFRGKELSGGNTTIGQRELRTLPIPADFGVLVRGLEGASDGSPDEIFALDARSLEDRKTLASMAVKAVRRPSASGHLSPERDETAAAAISRLFGLERDEHDQIMTWFRARDRKGRTLLLGP